MLEIFFCIYMLLFYMIVYFSFGSLVTVRMKKEKFSVTFAMMIGFFLYYGIFQVIVVPCTFLKLPLSWLAAVWLGLVALVVLYVWGTAAYRKVWLQAFDGIRRQAAQQPFWTLVPLLVVGAQAVFVVMWQTDYWDATYYIGDVSLSVYTNTISLYDPLTGEMRSAFDIRHCFATYLVQDAVVCKAFGIHPLIEMKTVMGVVVTIINNLVTYNIARLLFKGNREHTGLMLVFTLLVNLFTYTPYTTSGFLLLRSYEGKAVLGSVIVPAVLYIAARLYRDEKNKGYWWLLFLLCQSSCAISSSSMTLIPVEVGALTLCLSLIKRDFRPFVKGLLCMTPCLLVLLLYVASTLGLFVVNI